MTKASKLYNHPTSPRDAEPRNFINEAIDEMYGIDDAAGRAARLYDKTDSAPRPKKSADGAGMSDDEALAHRLYDNTVKAGNPAWRSAMRSSVEDGLVLQSESDKAEADFMAGARAAGLYLETVEALVGATIGKPPASAEQRDEFERAARRRLAQEFGDDRVAVLRDIDKLLAKAPKVRDHLRKSGRLFDPVVMGALVRQVRG